MGLYNCMAFRLQCPRCLRDGDVEIDLYFGFRNLIEYRMGDRYGWTNSTSVERGGRPVDGSIDGAGYTQCPNCSKDFFVIVEVRNDILTAVRIDHEKKPYIA